MASDFTPAGDQPQAINELSEGLEKGLRDQVLLGVTGSGKTFTVAHVIRNLGRPTLVLAPNKTLAAQLYAEMKGFFPDNAVEYFVSYYDYYQPEAYVPRSDTYIEKDASINEQIDRMRHAATRALLERADVIIANNVVANIDDLDAVGEAVGRLLAPGGAFVFESGYLLDLVCNNVFDNIYHEHLSYLSAKPLVSFFDRKGMEVVDVEHVPTKGGSIRVTTQLKGGGRKVAASVARAVAAEEAAGVYTPEAYAEYGRRLAKMKSDLLALLDKLRGEGKKIAGYGASTSVTTLGYYFEVWDKLEFIVDDNPVKQNRFNVPVVKLREVVRREAEWLFVFDLHPSTLKHVRPIFVCVLCCMRR